MSLSTKFEEMIEDPMNKNIAAAALALATVFSLSGCAGTRLNLPEGNVGGIPVGRVVNQSINRDVYDAKRGLRGAITEQIRPTACAGGGVVIGDPRQCDRNYQAVPPRPSPYQYNR